MSDQPLADSAPISFRRPNRVRQLARLLAAWNIQAHHLAVAGVLCAAAAAGLMLQSPWWALGAALCIQLRRLCQRLACLLDGDLARRTAAGRLYQELPDRIADPLLMVAAGYAAGWPALGWFGALAATLAAFVRVLGALCQPAQDLHGPMSGQHRLTVLTMACLLHAMSHALPWMAFGVGIIAAGALLNCVLRTRRLARTLLGESDVTTQSNVNS